MTKKEKWTCPKCGHHIHSKRERHLEICDGLGPGASKRKKDQENIGQKEKN